MPNARKFEAITVCDTLGISGLHAHYIDAFNEFVTLFEKVGLSAMCIVMEIQRLTVAEIFFDCTAPFWSVRIICRIDLQKSARAELFL